MKSQLLALRQNRQAREAASLSGTVLALACVAALGSGALITILAVVVACATGALSRSRMTRTRQTLFGALGAGAGVSLMLLSLSGAAAAVTIAFTLGLLGATLDSWYPGARVALGSPAGSPLPPVRKELEALRLQANTLLEAHHRAAERADYHHGQARQARYQLQEEESQLRLLLPPSGGTSAAVVLPDSQEEASAMRLAHLAMELHFEQQAARAARQEAQQVRLSLEAVQQRMLALQQQVQEAQTHSSVQEEITEQLLAEASAEVQHMAEQMREKDARLAEREAESVKLQAHIDELTAAHEKVLREMHERNLSRADELMRRMRRLYPGITVSDKALRRLVALDGDAVISFEAQISQLHHQPDPAVFRKHSVRGKGQVFKEIRFRYSSTEEGRIYVAGGGNSFEVALVGSKNSQPRDIAYLRTAGYQVS